ncbi:MAG: FAD-dependent oxidoreductase [Candidatus Vogelbacteria bacterium]|nr:FAD-dependent oxidoreductase [Candidatus Vogelbacteria bacterium]
MDDRYDLICIGSGVAGLSAALYAGRYKMRVLVIGEKFGGETATAGTIHNYPGAPHVDGYELMKIMRDQAKELGALFLDGRVTAISQGGGCFALTVKDKRYFGGTVMFGIGTERRHLNLPNETELTGRGVHFCITCDGPLYGGKTIAIVGGGDASVKGLNLAAEYAEKIYLITLNKSELNAEPINLEQMKSLGDKVEVIFDTTIAELIGEKKLERIVLSKKYKGSTDLIVDGIFVEIGAIPHVELAVSLGVALDDHGYIATDSMMRTNVEGVFAAGDIVNLFGSFKQDITGAAMGAVAATSAYNFHKTHGNLCQLHWVPEK